MAIRLSETKKPSVQFRLKMCESSEDMGRYL